MFVSVLSQQATQRGGSDFGVDRTVVHIAGVAKQGALDVLAEPVEQTELVAARKEIERLRVTVTEQAVALHLHQGKSRWD